MKKFMSALCVLALGAAFAGRPAGAATGPEIVTTPSQPGVLERMGAREMYNVLPSNIDTSLFKFDAQGQRIPDAFVTAPLWEFSAFTDPLDGNKYQPIWVGAVPNKPVHSNLGFYVLAFKFTFANKAVTDATTPSCGETVPVLTRFLKSPLLSPTSFASNGVALGSRQYIDAFQTAEFHGAGFPAGYETNFSYLGAVSVAVSVPKADGSTLNIKGCNKPVGFISQAWFDKIDQAVITQVVTKLKLKRSEIAFSLFNNTFMYGANINQCCIIGYHSAYGSNSTFGQLYGVGSYEHPGFFARSSDVSALSHELGELVNDPFGGTPTPAWGHIGQVSGCQGNYEVGDPLSQVNAPTGEIAKTLNGFTYHLQDLAFFSWFYRGTPKNGLYLGTGGRYSFNGTFTAASLQPLCR